MNLKTTLALLVLIGAGAGLWWYGQWPPALDPVPAPPPVADQGSGATLAALRPSDFTRIEVVRRGGAGTVLQRKPDGAWGLPGNWPVRDAEVNALVDLLASLRSRFQPEPLPEPVQPDDLEKYGLKEPAVTVKLEAVGHKYRLAFGEKAAAGDNSFSRPTYLRLDEKPEVLRLAPGVLAALDRPTDYYQQRRLFPGERVAKEGSAEKVEQLAAQRLTVEEKKPGGPHFALTHGGRGWELAEPVRDRLETNSRDALLSAVPDLWAEQFVVTSPTAVVNRVAEPCRDLPSALRAAFWASPQGFQVAAGLASPERSLTVKDDKGDVRTLLIGGPAPSRPRRVQAPQPPGLPPGLPPRMTTVFDEYRYAKLQNNDQIFEIKADKLKDVFVALDTLRDARLARFQSADARKIEIKHGKEDIVLEKDKGRWRLVKPFAADADSTKVTDLLGKLSGLEARDKNIIDKVDPKMYVLDKPAAEITVTVEEEKKGADGTKSKKTRTVSLRVGKHDTDRKKLYVQAGDWPRVNAVEDSLEPLVSRPALAYRGKRLFDFNPPDLAKIEVQHQNQAFTLERTEDGWRLVKPVSAEADALKVDQLASSLGNLEAVEYVNESPKRDDLEPLYGLGKPALIVKIEFKDRGKPPHTLHVGKARGGKGGYFAQFADKSDRPTPVFVVSADFHTQLERDSLSYRPLQLWQVLPQEIAALRIRKAGQKEYQLTRAGAGWKIAGPFDAGARAATVQQMTTELASPQAESCKAHEATDLKPYGLDKPALTVAVKGKDSKEHTLLIGGSTAPDAASRYAKLADGPAVFQIGGALAGAADRAALDLLDPVLLRLSPDKVERVRSKFGDTVLTLQKKGDGFRVTESPAGAFDPDAAAVRGLQGLWSNLRAERFADYGAAVDWAKYGFDKPAVTVTVSMAPLTPNPSPPRGEGKTVAPSPPGGEGRVRGEHTVELGKAVEGSPDARYARVDKGPGVAVLGPLAAGSLARTYLDYVNRDVLKFDTAAVTTLQRHAGPYVLEMTKKDDEWQVAKPAAQRGDDKAMQDLLAQLGDLHARRIAAYPVKNLKDYGLDKPAALVTIKLAGQKPAEHIIKLGKLVPPVPGGDLGGGDRFALVDDSKAVAVLPGDIADRLLGSPLTFRDRTIARFSDADRLLLERGPRKAVFSKVDGSWKLTDPLQADAEQDALDDLINSLGRLRADALVAEKPSADVLKRYGLDRPEARWRLMLGDKEVLNLLIGNALPSSSQKGGKESGTRRYARLAGGDLVFLLDARLSAKVLAEFRPRTVWAPPLDAVQVESLRCGYARNPFVLEKGESGSWQAAGKPDVKVNSATVDDTLAALAGLKLSRYAVDKGANLALFGLQTPELVLDVVTRSGKRVLHVGAPEGGSKRRYARIPNGDRSDVFVLDEADCARILRDLKAFTRPPAPAPSTPTR